jgi:hypothetical protein
VRLWSLHPRYLDTQGLLAVWREGLLGQAVLAGLTVGYRHHPQLACFAAQADPLAAIATYLAVIGEEAVSRGYHFSTEKIGPARIDYCIPVTLGQLLYEWDHLRAKLRTRAPIRYDQLVDVGLPDPHPMFRVVAGEVADWEIISRKAKP